MSLQTTSHAASSSEPQPEEHAGDPAEAEAAELNPTPARKANMIAEEVRVTVAGPSAGKGTVERELFNEETTSVLVFENGGVIRLSAAVTPGQFLLLTNVESKREAGAQGRRKRADRPTIFYVGMEFPETTPRFWGMEVSPAPPFC